MAGVGPVAFRDGWALRVTMNNFAGELLPVIAAESLRAAWNSR
ncbi:hypothetical protein [Mycobacterium kansasii]